MRRDVTGVEISDIYDGVAYWRVDGYSWHRWSRTNPIRVRLDKWAADHGVIIHDEPPVGYEDWA